MQPGDAARTLGRRGGRARAARLSADQKRRIASIGGKARSLSRHAAARISDNFRYLAAVEALRPARAAITRTSSFDGPLPRPARSDVR